MTQEGIPEYSRSLERAQKLQEAIKLIDELILKQQVSIAELQQELEKIDANEEYCQTKNGKRMIARLKKQIKILEKEIKGLKEVQARASLLNNESEEEYYEMKKRLKRFEPEDSREIH
jgi:hypothetical protein